MQSSLTTENLKEHLFMHLIKTRGYKRVAEVGVESGNLTGRILNTTEVDVYYAVDPWKVYIESYDRPPKEHEKKQSYWDSLYEKVVNIQKSFPQLEILRMTSVMGARKLMLEELKSEPLDCVYIDAIHDAENIAKDLYCWLPLVKEGGVVSGHDYIRRFAGMCAALDQILGDELNLILVNPDRPATAYKNTYQGGNWWVEVKGYSWKTDLILKIQELYPEAIEVVSEEWQTMEGFE